ncbi:hypothetical protein DFP72DRAFT_910850, partial [Ephemerocybe angulata]
MHRAQAQQLAPTVLQGTPTLPATVFLTAAWRNALSRRRLSAFLWEGLLWGASPARLRISMNSSSSRAVGAGVEASGAGVVGAGAPSAGGAAGGAPPAGASSVSLGCFLFLRLFLPYLRLFSRFCVLRCLRFLRLPRPFPPFLLCLGWDAGGVGADTSSSRSTRSASRERATGADGSAGGWAWEPPKPTADLTLFKRSLKKRLSTSPSMYPRASRMESINRAVSRASSWASAVSSLGTGMAETTDPPRVAAATKTAAVEKRIMSNGTL